MSTSLFTRLCPVAALLLMGFALPAWAESDPCKGSRPVGRDAVKLEAAVLGAVGNQRIADLEIKDVHLCHLGSPKISVRFESSRSRDSEGAQEWWTVNCWRLRSRQRWDCAADYQRLVELRTTVDGAERKIDLVPAANMTANAARNLALQSIALLDDSSAAPPRCTDDSHEDQRSWTGMRQYTIQRMGRDDLIMRIRTDHDGLRPGITRILLSEGFEIEYPSGCWSGWDEVIVTQ
jgi:hypothetical protein